MNTAAASLDFGNLALGGRIKTNSVGEQEKSPFLLLVGRMDRAIMLLLPSSLPPKDLVGKRTKEGLSWSQLQLPEWFTEKPPRSEERDFLSFLDKLYASLPEDKPVWVDEVMEVLRAIIRETISDETRFSAAEKRAEKFLKRYGNMLKYKPFVYSMPDGDPVFEVGDAGKGRITVVLTDKAATMSVSRSRGIDFEEISGWDRFPHAVVRALERAWGVLEREDI